LNPLKHNGKEKELHFQNKTVLIVKIEKEKLAYIIMTELRENKKK